MLVQEHVLLTQAEVLQMWHCIHELICQQTPQVISLKIQMLQSTLIQLLQAVDEVFSCYVTIQTIVA